MWLIGGTDWNPTRYGGSRNDVWSSSDGINWAQVTASAAWPGRVSHQAVVHDGKIWVIGGTNTSGTALNDVWYSEDGENWIRSYL